MSDNIIKSSHAETELCWSAASPAETEEYGVGGSTQNALRDCKLNSGSCWLACINKMKRDASQSFHSPTPEHRGAFKLSYKWMKTIIVLAATTRTGMTSACQIGKDIRRQSTFPWSKQRSFSNLFLICWKTCSCTVINIHNMILWDLRLIAHATGGY